jgi:hypothetical protein
MTSLNVAHTDIRLTEWYMLHKCKKAGHAIDEIK